MKIFLLTFCLMSGFLVKGMEEKTYDSLSLDKKEKLLSDLHIKEAYDEYIKVKNELYEKHSGLHPILCKYYSCVALAMRGNSSITFEQAMDNIDKGYDSRSDIKKITVQ